MASRKFMQLVPNANFTVLNIGDMEIWDGADMALLRESLTRLIKAEKHRRIGVDMSHVKYIPSGFFGMLFDWFETGVRIRLYTPQPNVRRMLWFNQFFEAVDGDCFELAPQPAAELPIEYHPRSSGTVKSARNVPKKAVARAGR
jgi:anti-anti-sigma regulatory factor